MKHCLLPALFFCALTTYGQSEPAAKISKGFIEVTGTASKEVTPDEIFVAVTLKNQVVDKQQYTIQQQEEALKKVLARDAIDPKLLSLTDASSATMAYRKKGVGYEAKKEFVLKLTTAGQVGQVAQDLQAVGITELGIAKTAYSGIETLQKEVRIAAIKAAKAKAEYLLQAIGEQLDKPLEVREENGSPFYRRPSFSNTLLSNSSSTGADEESEPETAFAKIQVRFSYAVKYGIK